MKPSRFFALLISFIGLALITSIQARAQTAYGYTEIDYDSSSNLVTAYAETDTDYGIAGDYKARVDLEVLDQNYAYLVFDSATDNNYSGYVSLTRQFSATAGSTYTATGTHYLDSYYNYFDYDHYGLQYWYDEWDFEQFASAGIDSPFWYGFTSPGYGDYSVTSPDLYLGET